MWMSDVDDKYLLRKIAMYLSPVTARSSSEGKKRKSTTELCKNYTVLHDFLTSVRETPDKKFWGVIARFGVWSLYFVSVLRKVVNVVSIVYEIVNPSYITAIVITVTSANWR